MSSTYREAKREALVEAIRESGLGVTDFAHKYLARDRSAVYRWLSGELEVPTVVANWLTKYADEIINGVD
jgi:hypothetical protein